MTHSRRQFLKSVASCTALSALVGIDLRTADAMRIEYPDHTVREFLKRHFAGPRTFSATGLDKKERYLTPRFRKTIYKFLNRVAQTKSSPPMVIDPFTGSQGATDYSIVSRKISLERARVIVRFTDGTNTWTITYHLRNDQERNDDTWLIDDIEDVRGMMLTSVLK